MFNRFTYLFSDIYEIKRWFLKIANFNLLHDDLTSSWVVQEYLSHLVNFAAFLHRTLAEKDVWPFLSLSSRSVPLVFWRISIDFDGFLGSASSTGVSMRMVKRPGFAHEALQNAGRGGGISPVKNGDLANEHVFWCFPFSPVKIWI